ncbi:MAG: nitrous oxide reductase family maturation protein NosD [Thioalkalispiraceae bacterium]|jgi:nitrous oxidase accessory protein
MFQKAAAITVVMCLLGLLSLAQARDWQVTAEGLSLSRVLASAEAGDRILIAPGHYRVNLVIDKPIVLVGATGAVLDGGGQDDVLRIRAPDVAVLGLQLQHSGRNLTRMNAVIFVEPTAKHVRIENNQLVGDAFGIWLDGSADARVIGNRIQGNPNMRSQNRGNGIHLFNTTGALVEDNEVWHTRDGIYIDTSNHNVLRRNYMHHLRYGIHYMYSYYNEVIDNRTKFTRTGYALMQSKHLTVTGNRSEHDQNYGMLMNYIVYSKIKDNVIRSVRPGTSRIHGGEAVRGAEGKAIFIYNSQFNAIHGNVFADSDIGIHLTAGSEDNTIFANAFVQNQTQVKYVATRPQEWSHDDQGNYWSDYLGYDMNADGVGDFPYEPNDGIDRVLWKYPVAKVLMHSPAVETLHWVQRQFPILRPPGVKDSRPLMAMPSLIKEAS